MSAARQAGAQEADQEPGEGEQGDQEEGDHVQAVVLGQVQVTAADLQVLGSSRPSNKLQEIHSHILRMGPGKFRTLI